jgi:hypothetical protein
MALVTGGESLDAACPVVALITPHEAFVALFLTLKRNKDMGNWTEYDVGTRFL